MTNSASPMRCLKYLLQADFSVLIKNKRVLILGTIVPIFLLVLWNSKKTLTAFGGPLSLIAISVTVGLLSTSVLGYAITTARDREKGVFQRLRVTPAPTWTIMVSRLLIQELANLFITLVVIIVGSHLYHISLSPGEYILGLLVGLLGGAVFLSIGQILVGLIKSADAINAAGRLIYIGLMLLGLLGLSGALGNTIETIAKWTPVGTVITVFAGAESLSAWNVHTSLVLLTCFGYIIVFGILGVRWFQWDAR